MPYIAPAPEPTPEPTPSSSVIALANGVASAPVTAKKGVTTFYSITVPSGASNLMITTAGGSGDADIFMKFGSQPGTTKKTYTWNSSGDETAETIFIASPAAGTYYITMNAWTAITNVTTKGAYVVPVLAPAPTPAPTPTPSPSVIALSNGVASAPVTAAVGTNTYYSIVVPSGASSLTITTTGGTGDDDF